MAYIDQGVRVDLIFDSWADYHAKLLMVLALAEGPLSWAEADLRSQGIHDPQLAQLLSDYLSSPGNRKLRLLIKDGAYLTQACPRLLELFERFVHRVEIRLTPRPEELDKLCAVISDGMILRRFHANFAKGRLESGPNIGLEAWLSRFEQLWDGAERYSAWQRISI